MARHKNVNIEAVEPVKGVVLEKAVEVEPKAINPKLVTEAVLVGKDENGAGGKLVNGIVSADGKSVTTLAGVTFAI